MRGMRQLVGPLAASATVMAGLAVGLGPASVAGASPARAAVTASAHCALPVIINTKPVIDSDDKSLILGPSECNPPSGSYETLSKTCVQVYRPGKGWAIAAYPGKALGTACNNHVSGKIHYGISKRYKSFDHYRILVLLHYRGETARRYSHIATFHTS